MAELIRPAPFGRRLAAATYDLMLLISLWFAVALIGVAVQGGEALSTGSRLFQGSLLGIALVFNVWFWTHGGQTLDMRAWRLQLRKEGGGAVSVGRASWRFMVAVLAWSAGGIGVLWALLHPENKTWQDLLSGTETMLVPAPEPDRKDPQ